MLPDLFSPKKGVQPPNTIAVIRRTGIEYVPNYANGGTGIEDDGKESNELVSNVLGSVFTAHSKEMRWTCYYFYSSGSLKDQYDMDFHLGAKLSGTGEDALGEFFLEGESDTAFGVTTFGFAKTYANRGQRPRSGHVSHICHFDAGTILGPLSMGIWGVWEAITNNPHFELQKGGVFRMIPSYLVEGLGRDVDCWDIRENR